MVQLEVDVPRLEPQLCGSMRNDNSVLRPNREGRQGNSHNIEDDQGSDSTEGQ